MSKRIVEAPAAGAPVGPYSQAVVAGEWIFLSGEKGVDPKTGEIVPGGVGAEVRQAFENIKVILEAAGAGLEDVVRCVVYLGGTTDFAAMNEAYAPFFPKDPPVRSTVMVDALPLGLKALVEVTAWKKPDQ